MNVTVVPLVLRAHPSGTETVQPAFAWYGTNCVLSGMSPGGLDSVGTGCSVGTGASVDDGVCARIEPVGAGGPVAAEVVVVPAAQAASSTPHPIVTAVIASRRIHASSSSSSTCTPRPMSGR